MANELIQKALERIKFHESEIARLHQFIATAEEIAGGTVTSQSNAIFPTYDANGNPSSTETAFSGEIITVWSPSSSPTATIIAEAVDVFQSVKKPVPAAFVYDRLVRRGIKIAGKNPRGNLTAKFATRKDIFCYDKDTGLWTLREWHKNEAFSDLLGESS